MDDQKKTIMVFGATSLVGEPLLKQLRKKKYRVIALSRNVSRSDETDKNLLWLSVDDISQYEMNIEYCISVAPIWVMPNYFSDLKRLGIKKIVSVSSTSIFSKQGSNEPKEKEIVNKLQSAEKSLINWAGKNRVAWVILRPTLIYGYKKDKNITEIAHFIQHFKFFPLLGKASGLRQPIHAEDVATACYCALISKDTINYSFQITGEETLTYKEMVSKVFESYNKRKRFVVIPIWMFRFLLNLMKLFPRYRQLSPDMVERMNVDIVFDISSAKKSFGFSSRKFQP